MQHLALFADEEIKLPANQYEMAVFNDKQGIG